MRQWYHNGEKYSFKKKKKLFELLVLPHTYNDLDITISLDNLHSLKHSTE
jgi:hypothetical protein